MALLRTLPELSPSLQVPQPQSTVWERFSEGIIRTNRLNAAFPQLEDEQFRLMMVSTIIGVRSPDTEGHAITNFARLRQIHADPDPVGQYAHALRGPDDDGSNGDLEAIEGLRQVIIGLVTDAFASRQKPPEQQLIKVPLYIDFYGVVDIEVWEPAYLIGRALHAIQDSFSHAIRTDDLKRIRHVLNYVDAIGGHHHEPTDGLPHSDFMDTCVGETEPIAMTASEVSTALVAAINEAAGASSVEPIRAVLDEWMVYEPGCTFENDYCDSSWLALARRDQTGPYLEEMLGCSSMPSASSGVNWDLLMTVLGLSSIILLRRRRRTLALLHWVLCCSQAWWMPAVSFRLRPMYRCSAMPPNAQFLPIPMAGAFVLDTTGRTGVRSFRSSAVSGSPRSCRMRRKGGVLNIGLGAQYRSAGGFVRSGAVFGTSTCATTLSSMTEGRPASSSTCGRSNSAGDPLIGSALC